MRRVTLARINTSSAPRSRVPRGMGGIEPPRGAFPRRISGVTPLSIHPLEMKTLTRFDFIRLAHLSRSLTWCRRESPGIEPGPASSLNPSKDS